MSKLKRKVEEDVEMSEQESFSEKSRRTSATNEIQLNTGNDHGDQKDQAALIAWHRRFRSAQVHLSRIDPAPFTAGRRLGSGGIGIVHETKLDGISLALKRTYTRKLSERDLNEIKILSQVAGTRHHHIIELVGSYVHRQRSGYEIGLLIWPVAHCDLASYLHDMDALQYWVNNKNKLQGTEINRRRDEAECATETLNAFWPDARDPLLDLDSDEEVAELHLASKQYLFRSFLCIAEAVAFLHHNRIRHKDLKPSQILLSPQGLWLTDFGWSGDMSMYNHSTTSNGENMTERYQAPERAAREPCSRSEDIFALGCTFLEMSLRIPDDTTAIIDSWSSDNGDKWSFQAHLHRLPKWILPLNSIAWSRMSHLAYVISKMMRWRGHQRPSIEEVINALFFVFESDTQHRHLFQNLCCPPLNKDCSWQSTGMDTNPSDAEAWAYWYTAPWLKLVLPQGNAKMLSLLSKSHKSFSRNHNPGLHSAKTRFWIERRHLPQAHFRSAWSDAIDEAFKNRRDHNLPSVSGIWQLHAAKAQFWMDNAHMTEIQRRRMFWEVAEYMSLYDVLQSSSQARATPPTLYSDYIYPIPASQMPGPDSNISALSAPVGFGEFPDGPFFNSSAMLATAEIISYHDKHPQSS